MKRLASVMILLALCAVARGQVQVDGTNDYARYSTVCNGLSNYTYNCFVKKSSNSTAQQYVFIDGNSGVGGKRASILFITNNLAWSVDDNVNQIVIFAPVENDGHWHMYSLVRDGNVFSMYYDGGSVAKTNKYINPIVNDKGLTIGASNYETFIADRDYLYGIISDFRGYTRSLSSAEISEIYRHPWRHAYDHALVLRTFIVTNDTGTALYGTARNLGTGADGTYNNSPTVAQPHVQNEKPLTIELP